MPASYPIWAPAISLPGAVRDGSIGSALPGKVTALRGFLVPVSFPVTLWFVCIPRVLTKIGRRSDSLGFCLSINNQIYGLTENLWPHREQVQQRSPIGIFAVINWRG